MLTLQTLSAREFYITTSLQAFSLSAVCLVLSALLSSPLFFLTELEVKESLITGETYSFCYEVNIKYEKKVIDQRLKRKYYLQRNNILYKLHVRNIRYKRTDAFCFVFSFLIDFKTSKLSIS